MDREKVITHLQIIHTWASFARERDLQFFTAKHLEDIAQWTDDALELLKEQETTVERDGHHIRCLNCGEYWCDNDREGNPFPMNFCPYCGKAVKRE
jgi:hypothetical protein